MTKKLFLIAIIAILFSLQTYSQDVAGGVENMTQKELSSAGWEQIVAYEVDYNTSSQRYVVKVELDDQSWWQVLSTANPQKLMAMQAFLRLESPIYVNTSLRRIHAFYEDIGEGEPR